MLETSTSKENTKERVNAVFNQKDEDTARLCAVFESLIPHEKRRHKLVLAGCCHRPMQYTALGYTPRPENLSAATDCQYMYLKPTLRLCSYNTETEIKCSPSVAFPDINH